MNTQVQEYKPVRLTHHYCSLWGNEMRGDFKFQVENAPNGIKSLEITANAEEQAELKAVLSKIEARVIGELTAAAKALETQAAVDKILPQMVTATVNNLQLEVAPEQVKEAVASTTGVSFDDEIPF